MFPAPDRRILPGQRRELHRLHDQDLYAQRNSGAGLLGGDSIEKSGLMGTYMEMGNHIAYIPH